MDSNMAMVGAPSAGGDLGSSAPAPGPGAGEPPADVLFTLTSMGATLAADKLTMTGVTDSALFSTASSQTGVYTTGTHPCHVSIPFSMATCPAIPSLWLRVLQSWAASCKASCG